MCAKKEEGLFKKGVRFADENKEIVLTVVGALIAAAANMIESSDDENAA